MTLFLLGNLTIASPAVKIGGFFDGAEFFKLVLFDKVLYETRPMKQFMDMNYMKSVQNTSQLNTFVQYHTYKPVKP